MDKDRRQFLEHLLKVGSVHKAFVCNECGIQKIGYSLDTPSGRSIPICDSVECIRNTLLGHENIPNDDDSKPNDEYYDAYGSDYTQNSTESDGDDYESSDGEYDGASNYDPNANVDYQTYGGDGGGADGGADVADATTTTTGDVVDADSKGKYATEDEPHLALEDKDGKVILRYPYRDDTIESVPNTTDPLKTTMMTSDDMTEQTEQPEIPNDYDPSKDPLFAEIDLANVPADISRRMGGGGRTGGGRRSGGGSWSGGGSRGGGGPPRGGGGPGRGGGWPGPGRGSGWPGPGRGRGGGWPGPGRGGGWPGPGRGRGGWPRPGPGRGGGWGGIRIRPRRYGRPNVFLPRVVIGGGRGIFPGHDAWFSIGVRPWGQWGRNDLGRIGYFRNLLMRRRQGFVLSPLELAQLATFFPWYFALPHRFGPYIDEYITEDDFYNYFPQ